TDDSREKGAGRLGVFSGDVARPELGTCPGSASLLRHHTLSGRATSVSRGISHLDPQLLLTGAGTAARMAPYRQDLAPVRHSPGPNRRRACACVPLALRPNVSSHGPCGRLRRPSLLQLLLKRLPFLPPLRR